MLLDLDSEKKAYSAPVDKLNWYGCWKCQHCLAVCPMGAISVLGLNPENSIPAITDFDLARNTMDALVSGRRSCRHFKQENVDRTLLDHILKVMENTPTGGSKMFVEYTLIDDIDKFMSSPVDVNLQMAYFELLCNAHGLGTVYLGFPVNYLKMLPEVYELLNIPEDHYVGSVIGFGYPAFRYSRGVQREGYIKMHRLSFDK